MTDFRQPPLNDEQREVLDLLIECFDKWMEDADPDECPDLVKRIAAKVLKHADS